jgi:hypothetical protein
MTFPVSPQIPPFDDVDALAAALLARPAAPRPPATVRRAMARADCIYEQLAAEGRRLHFSLHETTGRVVIEVVDSTGLVTGTLTPSHALAVAAGEPLQ